MGSKARNHGDPRWKPRVYIGELLPVHPGWYHRGGKGTRMSGVGRGTRMSAE